MTMMRDVEIHKPLPRLGEYDPNTLPSAVLRQAHKAMVDALFPVLRCEACGRTQPSRWAACPCGKGSK